MGSTMVGIGADIAQEVDKLDTLRAEDAWNRYKNAALDATIGDNGVLKKQAGDAVNGNLLGTVTKTLSETRQQILDSLPTDQQKLRFTQRADLTDLQTKHQVITHVVDQTKRYEQIVFDGSQAAATAQVRAAPTDPGVFAGAMATVMGQADNYLKNLGITDEGARAKVKDQISDNLWKTRIDTVMYNNPILADAMFRANQDQIKSPEIRLQMQARTRETSILVNASNEADKLIAETRVKLSQPDVANGGMMNVGGVEAPLPKGVPAEEAGAFRAAQAAAKRGERFVIAGDYQGETAFATNGLPNSRDIAAQLPIMLSQVDKVADRIYGKDQGNPDRAAFIQRMQSEVKSKVSADVQGLNAIQREAQGEIIDAVLGLKGPIQAGQGQGGMVQVGQGGTPAQGGGLQKVTSLSQIQSNPQLLRSWQLMDAGAKASMLAMIDRNNKQANPGDPVFARQMWDRIHLPDGDPNKIDFYSEIVQPDVASRLSDEQIGHLYTELQRYSTPGGKSLGATMKYQSDRVVQLLKTAPQLMMQPDKQADAVNRWTFDVSQKVDDALKQGPQGKDLVRKMFMPNTPESVISPAFISTYITSTAAQGLAQGAAAVVAGQQPSVAPVAMPKDIDTPAKLDAWVRTLPPNVTRFMDPEGKFHAIPPRAGQPSAAAPSGAPEPAAQPTMDATGKIVPPKAAPAAETEIQMPTLVTKETQEQKRERLKREADNRNTDAGVAMVGAAVGAVKGTIKGIEAVGRAGHAVGTAVANVAENLNPTEQQRVVTSFRTMIKSGTYTVASEPIILDALDSGLLTGPEQRVATKMLRALRGAR